MIKYLLALLLASQLFLLPQGLFKGKRHFLAVYSMPNQWTEIWSCAKPDLYFESSDFKDFPVFLEVVKQKAGNQEIDLDLDMHGNEDGLALFQSHNTEDTECSFGYLLNEIDAHLNTKKVTVISEACYSGRAFYNTRSDNFKLYGKHYVDHPTMPKYKIYGIGALSVNCGNFIWLQYKTGTHVFFHDLREYKTEQSLGPMITDYENSPLTTYIFLLFLALHETCSG